MLWAAIAFLEFLLGAFALTALFNRYHLNPHANPAVRAARWFAERLSKWRVPPYGGLILWAAGGTALIVGLGIFVNAVRHSCRPGWVRRSRWPLRWVHL